MISSKGIDWSMEDHLSIGLTFKSISWYLKQLRVIPKSDHYHIGIDFAPKCLTETKKNHFVLLDTLSP